MMKYHQQLDITDCGAACLAMVASHFGKNLSISEIRNKAGTDIIGTNVNGMLIAAKSYGMKAVAVKGNPDAITKKLDTPFIVHFHIVRDDNNWVDHYVVVKKITKRKKDKHQILALRCLSCPCCHSSDLAHYNHPIDILNYNNN